MIAEWIRASLDLVLIVLMGAGLWQAGRLIGHLAGLRQGRADMERFVHDFNATVIRAEAGIKGLRIAARESGDDLERLVGKACQVRDELQFLTESGDQIAERLSRSAANAMRGEPKPAGEAPAARAESPAAAPAAAPKAAPAPSSRAEKELLQALQKLN